MSVSVVSVVGIKHNTTRNSHFTTVTQPYMQVYLISNWLFWRQLVCKIVYLLLAEAVIMSETKSWSDNCNNKLMSTFLGWKFSKIFITLIITINSKGREKFACSKWYWHQKKEEL